MISVKCYYRIKEDIGFILEADKTNYAELSGKTGISRTTLEEIQKTGEDDSWCMRKVLYIYL